MSLHLKGPARSIINPLVLKGMLHIITVCLVPFSRLVEVGKELEVLRAYTLDPEIHGYSYYFLKI